MVYGIIAVIAELTRARMAPNLWTKTPEPVKKNFWISIFIFSCRSIRFWREDGFTAS